MESSVWQVTLFHARVAPEPAQSLVESAAMRHMRCKSSSSRCEDHSGEGADALIEHHLIPPPSCNRVKRDVGADTSRATRPPAETSRCAECLVDDHFCVTSEALMLSDSQAGIVVVAGAGGQNVGAGIGKLCVVETVVENVTESDDVPVTATFEPPCPTTGETLLCDVQVPELPSLNV